MKPMRSPREAASGADLPESGLRPDRMDYVLAASVALVALAAYVRTLAPDVLYSDSAEFQALAYTLGTTHSTGYPIYLLLGRLVGFLPLRSPAWRINFFSALSGAVTVGGVYLLARYVVRNRFAAVLGSVALALTYTMWSQAIIAEVYTPGTAFLVVILLLLAHWQRDPGARRRALFFATALTCLGLGVHATVVLIAPTAVLFVVAVLWQQRVAAWRRCLVAAVAGFVVGLTLYFLTFIVLDLNNPPSSFIRVTLYPSRSIWGLESTDLDSVFERWWLTVSGVQWQDAMFPEGQSFFGALGRYLARVQHEEFSLWMLLCALVGLNVVRWFIPKAAVDMDGQSPLDSLKERLAVGQVVGLSTFMLATYIVMMIFVLNYYPGDKHIFYLPTYLFFAIAVAAGAGRVLDGLRVQPGEKKRWYHHLRPLVMLILGLIVLVPHASSRWDALETATAGFVYDTYPYPVENLQEPRQHVTLRLQMLPEDAFLVMEWRALYTTYYLAHVEGLRPDLVIKEAMPHGAEGEMAETLLQKMDEALLEGRPVIVDKVYPGLRDRYRVMPVGGSGMYRLTSR